MVDGATDLPGIHSLEATSDPGLYEQDPQYLCLPTLVVSEDDSSLGGLSIEHDIHDPCHEVNSGVILRQQVLSRDHLGRTENLAQNRFVSVGSKYPALPRVWTVTIEWARASAGAGVGAAWLDKVQARVGRTSAWHARDVV
ncbi:hypothetical protein GUJ93_ZPchr0009g652 [Zizania palustris]|uniref:Uncharacterized protein n=1 Tax=Zizania palustris TaxID=103762 RepID=A0A8J5RX64_ZIZPA|nr:hypothetical protein GUJ93_ZPchr0009g652 [Zizania palustris]